MRPLEIQAAQYDKLRKQALFEQDATKYYSICLKQGVEPECDNLFKRGMLEYKTIKYRQKIERR